MRILLAILLLPLVDIASLVIVGPHLGVFGTLFMILLSVAVGLAVLRRSGLRAIEQLRATLVDGRAAMPETIDAALMALAGILFILPGFASDILALLLLLPPLRSLAVRQAMEIFARNGRVVILRGGQPPPVRPKVIDVDFDEIDGPHRP